MRRLVLLLSALLFFTACGGKKVQVGNPAPATPSASAELEGLASYYAEPYHGRKTANGETFDTYQAMTAAHRTLSFNTIVRVKNRANGKEIEVRINDRGPFVDGRVIDLSLRAARELDMVRAGLAPVRLEIISYGEARTRTPASAVFAVQVGAFERLEAAQGLKSQLEQTYPGVTIQTFSSNKVIYRVRIGRDDIQTAHKLAAELRKKDFDTFVVRVN